MAPPPKRPTSLGMVLVAFVLLAFVACCLVGMVAKRDRERDEAQQRAVAAAEQARLAQIERQRFAEMTPAAHLAAARAVLTNERGVNDATLDAARRNLDAVPADAGVAQDLAALNDLYARRARENDAANARRAAEVERERRRHEAACAPRLAFVRSLMEGDDAPTTSISAEGADCMTILFTGVGCAPETLWLYGRTLRRELRRAGFSTIRCSNSETGASWSQPLPVPPHFVPPDEPAAAPSSSGSESTGRHCRRGCPCGNSCIPCSHRCRH